MNTIGDVLAGLRERVRSLPVNDEDGLWVKTQVLRFLNEVTTPSEGPEGHDSDPSLTAAAAPTSAERRAAGNGST